jgi:hypothetical protein
MLAMKISQIFLDKREREREGEKIKAIGRIAMNRSALGRVLAMLFGVAALLVPGFLISTSQADAPPGQNQCRYVMHVTAVWPYQVVCPRA